MASSHAILAEVTKAIWRCRDGSKPAANVLNHPSFGSRGSACGNNFPIDAMSLGKF
jgi:hypothetical protein